MVAQLAVEIADEPVERARAELLAVFAFVGDRPPRGDTGRVDWRLCGRISQLIHAARFDGEVGQALLLPSTGGLLTPRILCLGLGRRADFDASACAAAGRDAVARAVRLRAASLALTLPDARAAELALSTRLGSLVAGAVAALADDSAELRLLLVCPPAEAPRAARALGDLAPRFRSAALRLRLPGAAGGRVRSAPQGAGGSAAASPPSIK